MAIHFPKAHHIMGALKPPLGFNYSGGVKIHGEFPGSGSDVRNDFLGGRQISLFFVGNVWNWGIVVDCPYKTLARMVVSVQHGPNATNHFLFAYRRIGFWQCGESNKKSSSIFRFVEFFWCCFLFWLHITPQKFNIATEKLPSEKGK